MMNYLHITLKTIEKKPIQHVKRAHKCEKNSKIKILCHKNKKKHKPKGAALTNSQYILSQVEKLQNIR